MTTPATKRDSGIDLLRLFSMGLIVLHHLLSHGGLLFAFPVFSASGMAMHLLNAFARCAVNTYALISGYVMVHSRFRPSRLIGLWLQVVFYGVIAVLCLPLMGPDLSATPSDWLHALMPVTHDHYWYFTCYAVIFCLSPALNLLLHRMTRKQAGGLALALVGLFSLLPALTAGDPFQLQNGYHFGWLLILYLLGGMLRIYGFGTLGKTRNALLCITICSLLAWISRLVFLAAGLQQLQEVLLYYTAPTLLLSAVALLALFQGKRLPKWLGKAAAVLSPLSFGVYLIHDNPLVREHLLRMRMTGLAGFSPVGLLGGLFVCWFGIYAVCLLIEWLRTKLFALLRIPAVCVRMEKRLEKLANAVFPEADA